MEREVIVEPQRDGAVGIVLFSGGDDETIAEIHAALDAMGAPPCRFATIRPVDWDADYTPWPLDAPNGRHFSGNADELLPYVEDAITQLRRDGAAKIFLIGYSLGGLAALYFHSKLDTDGCASCSGSVWYPGFVDYLRKHPLGGKVYFSLGGKEKNTRDILMSANEDCTTEAYMLCRKSAERTTFAHEPGGHFKDPTGRMVRGIAWLVREF